MTSPAACRAQPSRDALKALVVEDETIMSCLIEDMLWELGCSIVWHASTVGEALGILGQHMPDAAILDVNLVGEDAYPIAAALEANGIPFVFATGSGLNGMVARWAAKPVIRKPFDIGTLQDALGSALCH